MTTDTGTAAAPVPAPPRYLVRQRVTLAGVLRSEWTKLRSLRSTVWSLSAAVVLIVGVGALVASVRRGPARPTGFDPTAISLTGVYLAQLAVGVLGVLLVTGEYATGMIRTSLAAVPRRLPVLWAKAAVFALTTTALCLPATVAAFLLGQSVLSAQHLGTTLGHPGAARAVLGGALFLTAVGLLGLGLGALLRNTAGAVSALFGLLFVLPITVGFLPGDWSEQLNKYLPMAAGTAITDVLPDPTALGPWSGLGLCFLYPAAALGLAARQLRRRDA